MEHANRSQPAERLSAALRAAADGFGRDPALAEARARDVLASVPGQQQALLLLVCARRLRGDKEGARAILEAMAKALPGLAAVHYELGLILGGLGETGAAVAALSRVVELEPNHPAAWRALGNQLGQAGDNEAAGRAFAKHFSVAQKELALLEGATAQADAQLGPAEAMLRELLSINLTDVSAMHMLAKIGIRLGRYEDVERLLARTLELAPGFTAARYDYAKVLQEQRKWEPLLAQVEILLGKDRENPSYRVLKAEALTALGYHDRSIENYEAMLSDFPEDSFLWTGYGHALRTLGRYDDSISAYRRAVALSPELGRAWWSLANLKTFRFTAGDVQTMQDQLRRSDLPAEDRYPLNFALGKALEDREDFAESFANYHEGNRLQRAGLREIHVLTRYVQHCKTLFTPGFFRDRAGAGCPTLDPIFIVGLPRSGSTLLEQILSSHSAIEGTAELPDITHIVVRLNGGKGYYPTALERLDGGELRALGEEYLQLTQVHRKLGRPFFIDKMPSNFEHVALIHLMLPNAKIVDVRRHPLGCCFSNFKQYFENRLGHSCELGEIGRYYRDYVELMAHFDAVLPGRVHRVFYENMVRDPEIEIRRMLAYCGVAFEETCLRFHETERGVRTASSEQVRRPIYTEALEQWRNFEPWLGPLKSALGPVLELYPAVPVF
jgi:tetratricopeptide (TPR) repeat protein